MGQTFVRHTGHSEENEGIPWQGDLTLEGQEGESKRYTMNTNLGHHKSIRSTVGHTARFVRGNSDVSVSKRASSVTAAVGYIRTKYELDAAFCSCGTKAYAYAHAQTGEGAAT